MLQHGAYFILLNTYYMMGGPLPESTEHLTRICGAHTDEEISAISFILSSFFSLKSDGWHNRRADEELKESRRISKIRRQARLNKRKSIVPTNDNHLQTQSQSQSHTHKERTKNKAASAFVLPDWISQDDWQDFEEMRRKIRKPMTDRARAGIVSELFKLRMRGFEPGKVIGQSIRNSWVDVYELKGASNGTHQQNSKPSRAREIARNNAAAITAVLGSDSMGFGAVKVQGTDRPGDSALEGEVKCLPERTRGMGAS